MRKPQEVADKTPMERLAAFTRKLIAVPKTEIDKRAREYDNRKRERKAKGILPVG